MRTTRIGTTNMNVFRGDPGWKFGFGTLEESEVISQNRIARDRGTRPRRGVRQRSCRRARRQDRAGVGRLAISAAQPRQLPLPRFREGNVTADKACPNSNRAGLCASCKQVRIIRSDRGSVFYLCRRSATDPTYPQYPRLPVLFCRGYEAQEKAAGARNDRPTGDAEPSE